MREKKLGLVVPSSNTTMEREFWEYRPKELLIYTSRMKLTDVTPQALEDMYYHSVRASSEVADAEVDLILYGCTTGSLLKGVEWERNIVEKIERETGIKTITTSGAVISALKKLKVNEVEVYTPYIDSLNELERKFLEENDIKVIKMEGLRILKNTEIGKLDDMVAYEMALKGKTEGVNGIFISCTNFRTFRVLDRIERERGVPVTSSNASSLWLALRELKINPKEKNGVYSIKLFE